MRRYSFYVYNRNGQTVFSSVGYSVAWDGRYQGSDLPIGTYYYVIDLKDGESPISGAISLIR